MVADPSDCTTYMKYDICDSRLSCVCAMLAAWERNISCHQVGVGLVSNNRLCSPLASRALKRAVPAMCSDQEGQPATRHDDQVWEYVVSDEKLHSRITTSLHASLTSLSSVRTLQHNAAS